MKIKALPVEERPLEKGLFKGMDSLSNSELLALLINSGTTEKSAIFLAEEILSKGNGLMGIRSMSAEELMEIKGVGKGKAARILAATELAKRFLALSDRGIVKISSSKDVANLMMEELRLMKKEFFKALLLNSKGDIISVETVSIGELSSTVVHPREAFHVAIKKSAAAVIFVHNHPSGDSTPSREDILTTKRLVECGKLLGIRVLDHIVTGDGNYTSIMDVADI